MTDADKRAALLRQEKVMAIVMNGLISIGFFFLVFGWHPASSRALALDFLPQSFGVTFLGSLVPSLITYGRISRGKVVAAGPVPGKLGHLFRIVMAALLAIVVFGGAAALLTIRFAPPNVDPLPALIVKTIYGASLGRLMTPPMLRSVLGLPMFGGRGDTLAAVV